MESSAALVMEHITPSMKTTTSEVLVLKLQRLQPLMQLPKDDTVCRGVELGMHRNAGPPRFPSLVVSLGELEASEIPAMGGQGLIRSWLEGCQLSSHAVFQAASMSALQV